MNSITYKTDEKKEEINNPEKIEGEVDDITEFKEYHGVNVSITAYLDRTKVLVSIDIGFGDVVYGKLHEKSPFSLLLICQSGEFRTIEGRMQPGKRRQSMQRLRHRLQTVRCLCRASAFVCHRQTVPTPA